MRVFQRRLDGTVNFYRPWDHYKKGFGKADGEYWLGLDNIVLLTMRKRNQLRVDMEDWEGGKVYAQYTSFSVDPETFDYTLRVGSYIDGGAGDSLTYHNGMKFSTYNRDQDLHGDNCAKLRLGGFWYNACYSSNPNGLYAEETSSPYPKDIFVVWYNWKGAAYSLKRISLKMRPV